MKLKTALAAVALIAGSAWAGKVTFPNFTVGGSSVLPRNSIVIGDFDNDSFNDIIVSGVYEPNKMLNSWGIYSWKKGQYLYTSDTTYSSLSLSNFSSSTSVVIFGDSYYTYDGTTAASPNP